MKCNVKEKTVPFEFDGKTYQLMLNFNIIAAIQEKYGDIDTCFNGMDKAKNQIWLLCTLLNEAAEMHNENHQEQWDLLTETQVGRRIHTDNVNEIMVCIAKVMGISLPDGDEKDSEKNGKTDCYRGVRFSVQQRGG